MKLLSYADLESKKGIRGSKSTINRLEKAGKFPRRVRLSPAIVGWPEHEIDEHLARLLAARDGNAGDGA
jgi:prophage regulatory protein